ncbi:MAG: CHRD domain-containing protein [Candidatus Binatia bacterium]|nr:CHRD domain-containing protein [Candidatus Binatia bacterium]
MQRKTLVVLCVLVTIVSASARVVWAQSGKKNFKAGLEGFQEVPVVSTTGQGELRARINRDNTIDYELTYSGLEGDVVQVHLHVAQKGVNGGIVAFLCANPTSLPLPTPPSGTPSCPLPSGTVAGTLDAGDIVGLAQGQGFAAGEMGEVINALRKGVVYVNVHTTQVPSGEVRGQLR